MIASRLSDDIVDVLAATSSGLHIRFRLCLGPRCLLWLLFNVVKWKML